MKKLLLAIVILGAAFGSLSYSQSRPGGTVPPTVSNCGTAPSVSGFDVAGVVTTGSGSVMSCQVNFGQTYSSPLICVAVGNSTFANVSITDSTPKSFTMGLQASMPLGKLYYHCFLN